MSSIRNKISTKELIDAILKITNSVILYDRKPLEKDICKHNTLTCALFSNMTTSKKEMETIRKIGTKDNRNLSENNILTFLDNFYDGDQFYNYADTFSSKKSDSEMYVYATDTDALLNQINALYCSINPYPWVDVLEDNTVAEEEPDEEPNKKPNEGPDDTIMKQLLSLLVYTNYCGTLIHILHRELLNYIRKRANSSISSLKKDYLRNFTIGTLSDDEKISIQDAMFFGSHGYFVNDTEEDKENHYTPATIAHTAILLNFYYSILIFCYEYGLNNLAKNIFDNANDLSAVLFITSDSYEKTLECQLLQKNYSVLFSNLPFDQIQQKIVQLFCIFENGTFKKQFKQYSKKTI